MPLLDKNPISYDKVVSIIAFDVANLRDKICDSVPQVCPGRSATYLVDLKKLAHPDDTNRDAYGAWGQASGSANYYSISEDFQTRKTEPR